MNFLKDNVIVISFFVAAGGFSKLVDTFYDTLPMIYIFGIAIFSGAVGLFVQSYFRKIKEIAELREKTTCLEGKQDKKRHDREVLGHFFFELPPNKSVAFLRHGGIFEYYKDRLDDFYSFQEKWSNNPERYYFNDEELNQKMNELAQTLVSMFGWGGTISSNIFTTGDFSKFRPDQADADPGTKAEKIYSEAYEKAWEDINKFMEIYDAIQRIAKSRYALVII